MQAPFGSDAPQRMATFLQSGGIRAHLAELCHAIAVCSRQTGLILGAKDHASRHLAATDAYATLVGLRRGMDVAGRLDTDMPCEGTARFADHYLAEDREVMAAPEPDAVLKVLNIHWYGNGLRALIFEKRAVRIAQEQAAIGTVYSAHEIDPTRLLALLRPGTGIPSVECSVVCVEGGAHIAAKRLTPIEHEVSFLLAIGWSAQEVASFLDRIRPRTTPRSADTVYKCRARICEKLGLSDLGTLGFRELLLGHGMLGKLPATLLRPFEGSHRARAETLQIHRPRPAPGSRASTKAVRPSKRQ